MRKLKHSKALSLVEVMVAVFVTSIVAIVVITLLNTGNRTFFQVSKTSDLQNESNLLFSMIERDLARSGFVHPLRGDIDNTENCQEIIAPEVAINIVSATEVSSCFDRPGFEDENVLRYKITYRQGPIVGVVAASDSNTLYKRVERTNDCNIIITQLNMQDVMGRALTEEEIAITHGWQPVSDNIGTINFSYPTIGGQLNENILDVDILFQTRGTQAYQLPFRKRVYLKNKSVVSSSGLCDNRCPNSKRIFADYDISNNVVVWDPAGNNIPSASVVIQTGFIPGEDKLKWNTDKATAYSLTVNFSDETGVLKIDGGATGTEYEDIIRSITYVNTRVLDERTAEEDPNRTVVLALGNDDCSPIGRKVGNYRHFYCYIEVTNGGHGAHAGNNNWLWWGEAKLEAEAKNYFNLRGYLANITTVEENDYILGKIRKEDGTNPSAWFGGTDAELDDTLIVYAENSWRWGGGPDSYDVTDDDTGLVTTVPGEVGHEFYVDDDTLSVFPPWQGGHPDNASYFTVGCNLRPGEVKPGITLRNGEHCEDRPGEHYTQFRDNGDWNDVALSGKSEVPYQTKGYIIEWGTNFVTAAICNADNADNRLACVNFYLEQELVLADGEFRDVKMLDLCDPEP